MSFSMEGITVTKKHNSDKISKLFTIIRTDSRLTKLVKSALDIYVRYMITTYGSKSITIGELQKEIDDLLVYSCDKNKVLINEIDVRNNECIIIDIIKQGIQVGSLKNVSYTAEKQFNNLDSATYNILISCMYKEQPKSKRKSIVCEELEKYLLEERGA